MTSEADLQAAVLDLARLCGWRAAHFRPARTDRGWRTPVSADGKGFPDLVLVHRPVHGRLGRLLFVELKSQSGRLMPHQAEWIAALRSAGADVRVWRPADWDEIETTLRSSA